MKFKYLRVTSSEFVWGKHEMSKEYFVVAVKTGDTIINLDDMTYYSADENAWLPIKGDEA